MKDLGNEEDWCGMLSSGYDMATAVINSLQLPKTWTKSSQQVHSAFQQAALIQLGMLKSKEHEGLGDVEEYREVIRKVGVGRMNIRYIHIWTVNKQKIFYKKKKKKKNHKSGFLNKIEHSVKEENKSDS